MRRLYRWLLNMRFVPYVLLFSVILTALNILTSKLPFADFTNSTTEHISSFTLMFYNSFIQAPIAETLIFQALPIGAGCIILKHWQLGNFRLRKFTWLLIIASAAMFSAFHNYHWSYVIATFITGFFLAFAYYVAQKRKQNAFITVTLIHACINIAPVVQDVIKGRITSFF